MAATSNGEIDARLPGERHNRHDFLCGRSLRDHGLLPGDGAIPDGGRSGYDEAFVSRPKHVAGELGCKFRQSGLIDILHRLTPVGR